MTTEEILTGVRTRYANQPIFIQAVTEFLGSLGPYLESIDATAEDYARLERMLTPERIITFRVTWEDDSGFLQHNTGYRVQFNAALGPYKGGLRFDPSVNEDILKFLGFEQIFKNSLTGLPLGAGKGGSNFDPKGKSDNEIRRFCAAFMTELARHIGSYTDVPAGDIGVGAKEIGYLYGAYKRIMNRTDGVLTGKGVAYNGSCIRSEATGYGAVYFIKEMLNQAGKEIGGMKVVISGAGNVATHAASKLLQEGAVPLTLSDRGGYLYDESGLSEEVITIVQAHKSERRPLSELTLPEGVSYHEGNVWQEVKADIYLPSATQNEIQKEDAEAIANHGAVLVAEGANMPSTLEAVQIFHDRGILFGPAKAVNAGGVAVSGLEMTQNAGHTQWTPQTVDESLKNIMSHIHDVCVEYGQEGKKVDYAKGANVGGFVRVFKAMRELGW